MKDLLDRIAALKGALNSTERLFVDVEVTLNRPISDMDCQRVADKKIRLDEDILSFYRISDGLTIRWKQRLRGGARDGVIGGEEQVAAGEVNIVPLKETPRPRRVSPCRRRFTSGRRTVSNTDCRSPSGISGKAPRDERGGRWQAFFLDFDRTDFDDSLVRNRLIRYLHTEPPRMDHF